MSCTSISATTNVRPALMIRAVARASVRHGARKRMLKSVVAVAVSAPTTVSAAVPPAESASVASSPPWKHPKMPSSRVSYGATITARPGLNSSSR